MHRSASEMQRGGLVYEARGYSPLLGMISEHRHFRPVPVVEVSPEARAYEAIRVVADPSCAPGEIRIENERGEVQARFVNVALP